MNRSRILSRPTLTDVAVSVVRTLVVLTLLLSSIGPLVPARQAHAAQPAAAGDTSSSTSLPGSVEPAPRPGPEDVRPFWRVDLEAMPSQGALAEQEAELPTRSPRWGRLPPDWMGDLTGVAAAELTLMPSWFSVDLPSGVPLELNGPSCGTIHDDDVTVTASPVQVGPCDAITFTIVATNDAVTATNVVISSAMPAEYTPPHASCSYAEVGANETVTCTTVFAGSCAAVSGQNTATLVQDGGPTVIKYTEFEVLPGAISVEKVDQDGKALTKAGFGDQITWTVTVENEGLGPVTNVRVTDTLGAGIALVSGTLQHDVARLEAGESYSYDVVGEVAACTELRNDVLATWACDGAACQTAETYATIDFVRRSPALDYDPTPVSIEDYCSEGNVFGFAVTNYGDGIALGPQLAVPELFNQFDVTPTAPVTTGVTAVDGEVGFFLPDIPGGESRWVTFTADLKGGWCGAGSGGGTLTWETYYLDTCDEEYFVPVRTSSYAWADDSPVLTVQKSASTGVAYPGATITYEISLDYEGPIHCDEGTTGDVLITDTLPGHTTVISDGGGSYDPVSGVITWSETITDVQAGFTTTVVVEVDDASADVCAACGTELVNTTEAEIAEDCCGCPGQTAQASASTVIVCDVTGDQAAAVGAKEVFGTPEVCSGEPMTFVNTYTFNEARWDNADWNDIVFTDTLDAADLWYVPESKQVAINGDATCWTGIDVDEGRPLVLDFRPGDFSACVPSDTLRNATLVITYAATMEDPTTCAAPSWRDWSTISVVVSDTTPFTDVCVTDSTVTARTFVDASARRGSIDVSVSGVPDPLLACDAFTVTFALERGSDLGVYDVALFAGDSECELFTDTVVYQGVQPLGGPTRVTTGLQWDYGDRFTPTAATTASVSLQAQASCTGDSLAATVHYNDLCNDQQSPAFPEGDDRACSRDATVTRDVRDPNLSVFKEPQYVFATGDTVTWTITIRNTGLGAAAHVVVTDTLAAGMSLVDLAAPQANTIEATTNLITVTYDLIPAFDPQNVVSSTRVITLSAHLDTCSPLGNEVRIYRGCQGVICEAHLDSSDVLTADGEMVMTNILGSIGLCETATATIRIKNAGKNVNYLVVAEETLPDGLAYVADSSEYQVLDESGGVVSDWLDTSAEPITSGHTMTWTYDLGDPTGLKKALNELPPGWVVRIRFQLKADCDYDDADRLSVGGHFIGVCGQQLTVEPSTYRMQLKEPVLELVKTGANATLGSAYSELTDARAGDVITWRIALTNTGEAAARHVEVYDVEPTSATGTPHVLTPDAGSPPVLGGAGTPADPWEVSTDTPTLDPDAAWTFFLTSTLALDACGPITDNLAFVRWGCTNCFEDWISDPAGLRTQPEDIELTAAPEAINLCGGTLSYTLSFAGPPVENVRITDTLPAGLVYSGTTSVISGAYGSLVVSPTVGDNPLVWAFDVVSDSISVEFDVRNATGGACEAWTGSQELTATLEDSCGNGFAVTGSAPLARNDPDLEVSKSPEQTIAGAGDVVTWTITIGNVGDGEAQGVVVTDVLESGFGSWAGLNGSGGEPAGVSGRTISWTLNAPIPASGSWTAQVTATVLPTGTQDNLVTATGNCDVGCAYETVTDEAHVTLLDGFDKYPEVQTATIGSIVVFTFTGSLWDEDALYEAVSLTDTLPTGFGYVESVLSYTVDADAGATQLISYTPTITPGWLQSGDIAWVLGDLSGSVRFNGVITAVVTDIASNYDGVGRANTLRLTYTDDGRFYDVERTADVEIVEPLLHLGKRYVTTAGCRAVLHEADFNDDTDGGWSQIGATGNVDAAGGLLNLSLGADVEKATQGSDFSWSFMARKEDDGADVLFVFRLTGGLNDSSYVLRWRDNPGDLVLLRNNVVDIVPGPNPSAPSYGPWHHFEIRATGSRIEVFVDGEKQIDVEDPSSGAPTGGVFRIHTTTGSDLSLDDMLITRVGGTGCIVGANDRITYTLTISNQGRLPGYDLVITDTIPAGMRLVTYSLQSDDPASAFVAEPTLPVAGAAEPVWQVNQLTPTVPFDPRNHTALTLTVVLTISEGITANTALLNQASLTYEPWPDDGDPLGDPYGIAIERGYSGGTHSTAVRTNNAGIEKAVAFSPPPSATLGTLVTYTLTVPDKPISATLYNVVVTDTIDERLIVEGVEHAGGTGGSSGWTGQLVTATFDSIPHDTQATITITARISHEWPSGSLDADDGDSIPDVGQMSHSTAPLTDSNQVETDVFEPNIDLSKSVASSRGGLSDLDGTALLTYTLRLTNTGTSAAYSLHIADSVPQGISVTAQYGGDARSGPVVGQDVLTWTVGYLSNTAPANVLVLTYTARISQALSNATLRNDVLLLYHSLTETIPGVRPYTDTSQVEVTTAAPTLAKRTEPPTLRVGDVVTYYLVFTVPAGTIGMGGNSYLKDTLPAGVRYITDSESLAWTPASVGPVNTTGRSVGPEGASQAITWTFGTPITSLQDLPSVITLTFEAQAIGVDVNGAAVWPQDDAPHTVTDTVELWQRGERIGDADADNRVMQPHLSIDKDSEPPPGAYVGALDTITYTLIIENDGQAAAFDFVVSDTLPADLVYVSSNITSTAPSTIAFLQEPAPGATGVMTWRVNELWGTELNASYVGVATLTMVAQVSDTVLANAVLTNVAAIPSYDSQPGDGPQRGLTPTQRTYDDGDDEVVHFTPGPVVSKELDKAFATIGEEVTPVIVAQFSAARLLTVTVTDTIDSRLTVVDAEAFGGTPTGSGFGPWSVSGTVVTGTWEEIPAQTVAGLIISTTVRDIAAAVAGGVISDVAQIEWTDVGERITSTNEVTLTIVEPDLSHVKTSDPPTTSTVGAGDHVTYTVTITNSDAITASAAYDVVFTDTVPAGMRDATPVLIAVTLDGVPVGLSYYAANYHAGTGVYNVNFALSPQISIPVGSELVIVYRCTVDDDVPHLTHLMNAAQVGWSSLPGESTDHRDYESGTVDTTVHTGDPDLALTKVATPTIVGQGDRLTYTITVTNSGIVAATGVVITDEVPAHTAYLGCGPTPCGEAGGVVSWTLGIVYAGESRTVTMAVQISTWPTTGATIQNTAWLTSNESLSDTSSVTTPIYASLGDYVWEDWDVDGEQDGAEPGIEGVTVTLYTAAGVVVSTTTTNASGYYSFTELIPGDYYVVFEPTDAYVFTLQDDGVDDTDDSDADPATGRTVSTTLVSGEHDPTWDAGLYRMDFGDDPDTYGTRISDDGARHVILPELNPTLGITVDAETDGQPFVNADGDDVHGEDDEDGVAFISEFVAGEVATVTVTAADVVSGYLNAWIDFGGDGAFDSVDRIASDLVITAGHTVTITFTVPTTATEDTYTRFRFSSQTELGPTERARDGEVEDYPIEIKQLDYGDAPDPDYPTVRDSDGARHIVTDHNPTLGSVVDSESDGQPNADATGDGGDEDGVTFDTDLIPGEVASVTVTVAPTASGYLNAWIDFNGDGDWDDAGEQIALDVEIISDTSKTITFTVPVSATQANTYARFRFSSDTGLAPTGLASDGEVEDYQVPIEELDYGDAPEPGYPVTYANNGARHVIVPEVNPTLGTVVDNESDGQPTAGADGDDASGDPDDEDGVTFDTLLVPGEIATITVSAADIVSGYLNAWIDFDGDGAWEPGEQIAADLVISAGESVEIAFTVPLSATQADTGARFRFNSDGGLGPTGLASDGEVEDYLVEIQRLDFGDLPEVYGTTRISEGARHIISDTNPTLGTSVDNESDGQPSPTADGDDANGVPDDEDGVTFLTPLTPGELATITVSAAAVADGYLNAWVDFNGNGTFDPGEQIVTDTLILSGTTKTISFTVPNVPLASSLYSRFRFNSDGGLSPNGLATDGEVEDYVLMSLGNRVWLDDGHGGGMANDGRLNGNEAGIANVEVELYRSDQTPGVDAPIATTTTDATGHYTFTGLVSDTYVVHIPASNFSRAGQLEGLVSSSGSGDPNGDEDQDVDENGMDNLAPAVNGITSDPVTLSLGDEPTDEDGDANSNLTVDFGFTLPAALGNYVWLDENNDGYQDAGEPGIPNVIVVVTDALGNVFTTTTDAHGGYLFAGLAPGTYTVTVAPENFAPGGALEDMAQTMNPVLAGADFGNQGQPYSVTLGPGDENLTADFGYNYNTDSEVNDNTGQAALGDRVWIDTDGDGAQDPGEIGIEGVELELYGDPDGDGVYDTLLGTTTTDVNGNYMFDGLAPGAYVVAVVTSTLPANYVQTGDPDHFGTTGDNDNITTDPVVLGPGDVFLNVDFGYQPPDDQNNAIGDTVWFDADGDGDYEPAGNDTDAGTKWDNEYGIPGVTVALIDDVDGDGVWDPGEPIIATDTTDENGEYIFEGLPDGDYIVWVNDTDNVLGELVQSGDPDAQLDDLSSVQNLGEGDPNPAQNLDQDFGYTPRAQDGEDGLIGDTIFLDVDNDGIPDPGEGLEGVQVILTNSDGLTVTATTDENGHYYFGNLPPGTYTITVVTVTLPAGVSNTVDPDGGFDSQSVVSIGDEWPLVRLDQDFGYRADDPGRIGNLIWIDSNADGVFDRDGADNLLGTDDDEPPIGGVTVDLYRDLNGNGRVDPGEPLISSAVTSDTISDTAYGTDGNYLFEGLPAGDYVVDVTDEAGVLAGYWHSRGSDGANNNSQADPYAVSIGPGGENLTADFGYYVEPAAVGNYVWLDEDGDGVQDGGEPPMEGVTVTLTIVYPDSTVIILTTTTDANGYYEFTNLLLDEDYNGDGQGPEPVYTISVETPPGYAPTLIDVNGNAQDREDSDDHDGTAAQPIQGQTDVSAQADPNDEPAIASYDFGFYVPASLGNYVWEDLDGDGTQNDGDTGLNGIPVALYRDVDGDGIAEPGGDDNGPFSTTVTADDPFGNPGYYTFTNLIPYTYFVVFDPTGLYTFTLQDEGADDTVDSDADPVTGVTAVTRLLSGENDPTWDAGLLGLADLGLTKSSEPLPHFQGQPLTYTLVVTNYGPSPARGVVLSDDLDANTTYARSSVEAAQDPDGMARTCSYDLLNHEVGCDLFTIAVNERVTVTIVTTATSGFSGVLVNTATVSAVSVDPNPSNDGQLHENPTAPTVGGFTQPMRLSAVGLEWLVRVVLVGVLVAVGLLRRASTARLE